MSILSTLRGRKQTKSFDGSPGQTNNALLQARRRSRHLQVLKHQSIKFNRKIGNLNPLKHFLVRRDLSQLIGDSQGSSNRNSKHHNTKLKDFQRCNIRISNSRKISQLKIKGKAQWEASISPLKLSLTKANLLMYRACSSKGL